MKWRTTTMLFEIQDNGILIINPVEDFKGPETLEHAMENVKSQNDNLGEEPKAILAYLPNHYINAAATTYYKEAASDVPLAMVGSSFFKRMIGNFLLKMGRPGRPVKLFSEAEDAMTWLEKELDKSFY